MPLDYSLNCLVDILLDYSLNIPLDYTLNYLVDILLDYTLNFDNLLAGIHLRKMTDQLFDQIQTDLLKHHIAEFR